MFQYNYADRYSAGFQKKTFCTCRGWLHKTVYIILAYYSGIKLDSYVNLLCRLFFWHNFLMPTCESCEELLFLLPLMGIILVAVGLISLRTSWLDSRSVTSLASFCDLQLTMMDLSLLWRTIFRRAYMKRCPNLKIHTHDYGISTNLFLHLDIGAI